MNNYEIKKGRKWFPAKAVSMSKINKYCEENGYSDFRVLGIVSNSEQLTFNTTAIIIK